MKDIEIAYTGTPVTDMKRARDFYEGVLGLNPRWKPMAAFGWNTTLATAPRRF